MIPEKRANLKNNTKKEIRGTGGGIPTVKNMLAITGSQRLIIHMSVLTGQVPVPFNFQIYRVFGVWFGAVLSKAAPKGKKSQHNLGEKLTLKSG